MVNKKNILQKIGGGKDFVIIPIPNTIRNEILIDLEKCNLEYIYYKYIQKINKCKYYTTARYNKSAGLSSTLNKNETITTYTFHVDLLSNDNKFENLITTLIYLDDAKLDYYDNNNIKTLDIKAGSILLFKSTKFIHRTHVTTSNNYKRRLIQYFDCCNNHKLLKNHYTIVPRENKFLYILKDIFKYFIQKSNSEINIINDKYFNVPYTVKTTDIGKVGEIGVHQPHTKISYKKKILLYKDIIPVFTFKQNYIS
jgi:hypothetical protein